MKMSSIDKIKNIIYSENKKPDESGIFDCGCHIYRNIRKICKKHFEKLQSIDKMKKFNLSQICQRKKSKFNESDAKRSIIRRGVSPKRFIRAIHTKNLWRWEVKSK